MQQLVELYFVDYEQNSYLENPIKQLLYNLITISISLATLNGKIIIDSEHVKVLENYMPECVKKLQKGGNNGMPSEFYGAEYTTGRYSVNNGQGTNMASINWDTGIQRAGLDSQLGANQVNQSGGSVFKIPKAFVKEVRAILEVKQYKITKNGMNELFKLFNKYLECLSKEKNIRKALTKLQYKIFN